MSSIRPTTPTSGRSGPSRRRSTRAATPSRAQLRDMEARSAATRTVEGSGQATTNETPTEEVAPPRRRTSRAASATSRLRAGARTIVLSRSEEYAYIRRDMRRLLLIAGGLLLVMMVLLFIVER